MTEEQHRDNMEFIRQASENAKVSLVLANIKSEIANYKLSEDEKLDMNEDSIKWGMKIAYDLIDKYLEQY